MPDVPAIQTSQSLGDATTQVVVLAFDLVDQEAANLPAMLQASLSSKPVLDAIQSALDSFILKKQAAGKSMGGLSPKDSQDLLNAIASSAGGKMGDAALSQIQSSPAYKNLQAALSDFQTAAKSSPMGVWVDKNSGLVLVTGIALVVGGAAVLYATKTTLNDPISNALLARLKSQQVQFFKVGNFTLNGSNLDFQPDKQKLGGQLMATEKWQQVNISVGLGAIAVGSAIQQINGKLAVKWNDVNLGFTATDALAKKNVNLGLTMSLGSGPLKTLTFGVGAAMSAGKVTGGSLDATLKSGNSDFGFKAQDSNKQWQGLATWTVHF